jgi:hypothetical protein
MEISALKTLITSLISYLPVNHYEFHIAMTSFSSKAKVEFYFNSYSQKTEMLAQTALRRQSPGAANINFKSFKTDKKITYLSKQVQNLTTKS